MRTSQPLARKLPTTVSLAARRFALMAAEHTVQIGRRIREQREKAGLTQAELAALIPGKTDGTQVSKWERGLHRPGDDTLDHIAKALKCPVAAFHVDPPVEGTGDLMGAFSPTDARLTQIEALLEQVLARLPDAAPQGPAASNCPANTDPSGGGWSRR